MAGRFDRSYGPGRSWQAFGQLLLRILPPLVVADLGSGEGLLSELLARRCKKVIAVDNSEKIVEFGAAKAKKNGLKNLEFRLGDLQDPPIEPASVDLVDPEPGAASRRGPGPGAARARTASCEPGGQVMILDLLEHQFEQARELYGDRWLGFAESDLQRWLEAAGFKQDRDQRRGPRGAAAAFPDPAGGGGEVSVSPPPPGVAAPIQPSRRPHRG